MFTRRTFFWSSAAALVAESFREQTRAAGVSRAKARGSSEVDRLAGGGVCGAPSK